MEYGVFNFSCINFGEGKFLYYNPTKRKNPLFSFQNVYLYQIKTLRILIILKVSVTNEKKKCFTSWSLVFLHAGRVSSFLCSLAPKIGWNKHMLLFSSRSLSFPLLNTSDTPFYQLGYQLGRFCLVVRLESVTILCQLWQSFPYLLVFCDDGP